MKPTTQNYLKAIFLAQYHQEQHGVKIKQVATQLDISSAAVTDQVKKLVAEGFVKQLSNRSLVLTQEGEKIAIKMVRYHRLWETFLSDVLGLAWDQIHDEAERLEHACSSVLIDKIDAFLNYPICDPHGNPIPNAKGMFPDTQKSIPLASAKSNLDLTIAQVIQLDKQYLAYLDSLGIQLGQTIQIKKKLDFDESLVCCCKNKDFNISLKVARHIFVQYCHTESN